MSRINSCWRLVAFLSALVLALLGVVYICQVGVVKMIFGEYVADHIYFVLSIGLQVLAYGAVLVIVGLGVWGVRSYIHNRGKPSEPSAELSAIRELGVKLDKLIELMENHYGTGKSK